MKKVAAYYLHPQPSNRSDNNLDSTATSSKLMSQAKNMFHYSPEQSQIRSKNRSQSLNRTPEQSPILSRDNRGKVRVADLLNSHRDAHNQMKIQEAQRQFQKSKQMLIDHSLSRGLNNLDIEEYLREDNFKTPAKYSTAARNSNSGSKKGSKESSPLKLPSIKAMHQQKSPPLRAIADPYSSPIKMREGSKYQMKRREQLFELNSRAQAILDNEPRRSSPPKLRLNQVKKPNSPPKSYVNFRIEVSY